MSKTTRKSLISSERRYRALFENSNDGIFIMDFNLTILLVNSSAARMLEMSQDDLMKGSARNRFKPEQLAMMESNVMRLLAGETGFIYEHDLIRADGSAIPAEISLTIVRDDEGEPLHIQAIVRDISGRKQTEKALNVRLEQLAVLRQLDEEISGSLYIDSVLLVALDSAMRISRSDAGFIALTQQDELVISQILGKYPPSFSGTQISPRRGIIGRVIRNHTPTLVRDVSTDPDYEVGIETTVSNMVIPLISKDNLVGMLNLETARPDTFNQENFEFVQLLASRIAAAIDNARLYDYVTRQLNETQELYHRVSRLEQMKTDMIRIASHDLKAPVALVEGYVELLKLDYENFDPSYHEYFEAMGRACQRMRQMIADILSLERIQQRLTGHHDLLFSLDEVVKRVIEELQSTIEARSQTLVYHNEANTPASMMGDETQIYEAVTNLIGNASKYTPEGGAITVTLEVSPEQIRFAVEDTGYGIPEDRQERLFEPFYRARAEGTEKIDGTGLGLHLVKNIVERHHGMMIFHSAYGKGSLFGFTLPFAR